jgi:hypothetical protein
VKYCDGLPVSITRARLRSIDKQAHERNGSQFAITIGIVEFRRRFTAYHLC